MSSDDDLDLRLQQAGARWREANTDVATVDFAAATTADATTPTDAGPPTEVPLVHSAPRKPRRRKRIWVTAIAGVAAVAAAAIVAVQLGDGTGGARPPAAGNPNALVGITWQLTQTRLVGAAPRPAAANASLSFDGKGQMVGNDGVAPFSGPVRLAAGRIEVGELGVGAIGGTNDDPAFVSTLDAVRSVLESTGEVAWSIDGTTLTLSRAGVGSLVYIAKAAPTTTTDPKALLDVSWQLTTIESGGAGGTSTPAEPSVLSIAGNGTFTADHRCYWWRGTARLAKGTADFTDTHTDPHSCPPPAHARSAAATDVLIDSVLAGATRWSVTADPLTVTLTITKKGVGSLVYQRADVDPGFFGRSGSPSDAPSATPTR